MQQLLDELPYNPGDARCPSQAFAARTVHCLDGALLAAVALRAMGYPALITFLDAEQDDGHALAVFKSRDGKCFGCVAKSNFSGIRYREPVHSCNQCRFGLYSTHALQVYRSMRELVMSLFDQCEQFAPNSTTAF